MVMSFFDELSNHFLNLSLQDPDDPSFPALSSNRLDAGHDAIAVHCLSQILGVDEDICLALFLGNNEPVPSG